MSAVESAATNEFGLFAIFGFSALLTSGGTILFSDGSRLTSPDRRGGGGEGGRDCTNFGAFAKSIFGVCGLLGIRKLFADPGPADSGTSVER